jgi:hypothetical protein
MRAEEREVSSADAFERRAARRPRPRRPWTLVAAALLLALLSIILWGNWRTARNERDRLDAELKKVYAEAESLRMEAALAKQRINQLEAQLRALSGARSKNGVLSSGQQPGGQPRPSGTKTNGGRSQSPLARRQRPVPHLQQPVVLLAGSDGDPQVTGEAHVGAVAHQDPRLEQRRPQPARLRVHLDEEEISLRRR